MFEFWFQILSKTCTALCAAHIASDFTCVYCAAAETLFGTTDVYELDFSYLSVSTFRSEGRQWRTGQHTAYTLRLSSRPKILENMLF